MGSSVPIADPWTLQATRFTPWRADDGRATKVVATASRKGKITDIVERPDYQARQRAVTEAWKLRGRKQGAEEEQPPSPPVIILKGSWMYNVFTTLNGGEPLEGGPNVKVIDVGESCDPDFRRQRRRVRADRPRPRMRRQRVGMG